MNTVFESEEACEHFLETLRWPEGVVSPFDPLSKVYQCKQQYRCRNSGKYFNVRTGTIMSRSRLDLREWLEIIDWINAGNKDPKQLSLRFNLSLKTAYALLKKVEPSTHEINPSENMSLINWLQMLRL